MFRLVGAAHDLLRPLGRRRLVGALDDRTDAREDRRSVLRRWLVLAALLLAVALVLATAAEARVTLLRVTSPVRHGSYATVSVKVSRPAHCSITVTYRSGRSSA